MEDLSSQTIKGYELGECIGVGGFGAVYRAQQITVGREVAIKIILPGFANRPDFIRRFETEAQLVARLEHPHIVPLHDYWRDPSGAYIVMRYLREGSLEATLQKEPFDRDSAARLLDQVTSALALAHRNDVIHRDLKPGNILLDEDGNAYLADFGIAKVLGDLYSDLTKSGVIGSLDYISPEQARSEPVSPQTDIYSLGVVLYEVLTGQHPFPSTTPVECLYKHLNDPLPEIAELGENGMLPDINAVIQKATAKNPLKRYGDVLEMAAAFRKAIGLTVPAVGENIVEELTLREQEVLRGILDGLSNREIANQLVITLSTVKWYVNQIYRKLGVRSRVQAIVRARELDLVIPDSESDIHPSVQVTGATSVSLPEPENPYQGLRPFQAADHRFFFGREKLVEKLVRRMGDGEAGMMERFLAVVGPSGSGKSSVVNAGLIPALWRGDLPGSERWFVVEMLPGAHPLDELEIALMRVSADQGANLREQLERDVRGLQRVAQLVLPKDDSELVLIIDQFEEIFTLVEDETARTYLLDLLYSAVIDPRSRVRVVVTMRADFYDRPLHYPDFGELIRQRMETVLPLSADELERAIYRPADLVGVVYEEGLVPRIIEEVLYQPGALPLLQYALTELFDNRQGRLLTQGAYQEMGGTIGALAKRADEIYESLSEDGQGLARQMFLRLVTLGEGVEDTRRRVPRSELIAITENQDLMEEIIDTYTSYRLLSLDNDPGTRTPTVEVAHEAILREWDRLSGWLDESRADIRDQRALARVAAEWSASDADSSFLLRGSRLDHFETWADQTDLALTGDERAFLDASLEGRKVRQAAEAERQAHEAALERRSQRFLQALVGVFAVAAVIAVILSLFAFNAQKDAEQQASIAQARELSQAAALNLENDPELAILLSQQAISAWQSANQEIPPDLEETLHRAVQSARALYTWQTDRVAIDIGFNSATDHPYLVLAETTSDTVWVWDPIQDEEVFRLNEADIASTQILADVSPDGSLIAIPHADNMARVYKIATGELVYELPTETTFLYGTVFSPDGRLLGTTGESYVGIWDLETNTLAIPPYTEPTVDIASFRISFSADGSRVAWSSLDNTFRVINAESGEVVAELVMDYGPDVYGVALSPDGKRVAAGGFGDSIQLWDLRETQNPKPLNLWHNSLTQVSMMFNPHYDQLAFAMQSGVMIWDLVRDEVVLNLSGKMDAVRKLAYNQTGDQILTYSVDGKVVLWDLSPSYELQAISVVDREFSKDLWGLGLAFHPDGDQIAVSEIILDAYDGLVAIKVFDLSTGDQLLKVGEVETAENQLYLDYSPDGTLLAGGQNNGKLYLWDSRTGELLSTLSDFGEDLLHYPYDRGLHGVDFSPICSTSPGESCPLATVGTDGQAIIWDANTGEQILKYQNEDALTAVAFSPDGILLAFGNAQWNNLYQGGVVKLMDVASGEILQEWTGIAGWTFALAFSPDGKFLALGTTMSDFRIMAVGTGAQVHKPDATNAEIRIVYTPDGKYLLTNNFGGETTVWDAKTGERLYVLAESPFLPLGLAISPDGSRVAVGSDSIYTYILDMEQLAALGQERLTRSFTLDECQKYLHLEQCPE
jgi:serine/threonine protein kinase/WD40 repeat protein